MRNNKSRLRPQDKTSDFTVQAPIRPNIISYKHNFINYANIHLLARLNHECKNIIGIFLNFIVI